MKNFIFFYLLFFFFTKVLFATVVYEKEDIFITELDINIFKEYYSLKEIEGLNKNQIIKEIYLIKKIINKLKRNNPKFISTVDNIINSNNQLNENNNFILDLYRYSFIRNDFMKEYFNNKLNIDDINNAFQSIKDLKIPLSTNGCLFIDKVKSLKEIKNFNKIYLNKIKNKDYKLMYEDESNDYEICLDQSIISKIDIELIKIIEFQTQIDFKQFIYEK